MNESLSRYMENKIDIYERFPSLAICNYEINQALAVLIDSFRRGGKLMICGNGGSAADALHIVGELQKSFLKPRRILKQKDRFNKVEDGIELSKRLQEGLPAISLVSELSLGTAVCNDIGAEFCFAQQVWVLGQPNDVLLCISTSGNSTNVVYAAETAQVKGCRVISMLGNNRLARILKYSDVSISVPESETYRIQELHLPIYHYICQKLEREFF